MNDLDSARNLHRNLGLHQYADTFCMNRVVSITQRRPGRLNSTRASLTAAAHAFQHISIDYISGIIKL